MFIYFKNNNIVFTRCVASRKNGSQYTGTFQINDTHIVMYVKLSTRRWVCPSTCTARVVHISVYQTKEGSEVVCQILSSLSQWPYGNTFHCTHRHKSAANTSTKHPHTSNSSQTVTAINGTEPSWELQILLQPKPVDKCYITASIIHSHTHYKYIN